MRRFAFAVLSVVVASAQGQIVLKPSGNDAIKLSPKTVDVRAEIRGGVADTVWTYTFANANRFRGQADFLIAIPKGGVVHGFAYWYQGEKVVARVTEKERAKRIYQAIVARQRDPALIEMVGKNTFRVRVFPIDGEADLKVELKMAEVLGPHLALPQGGGATYSIPLRSLGKLESATVEVRGDQKLQGSWGPVGTSLNYSISNSNAADLKVTEAWGPQALHASLNAARSGGTGGFFAVALTPSKALRHRRWRLDGDVTDVIEVANSIGAVTLVGRYRKPGPVRAWLVGDGYKASVDLTMPDTIEANGPSTKLWAWSKIGRSKDRKEIVALSMRHGVPSKFTSWIAIPTEERKRMAREIARAEVANEVARVAPTLIRVGLNSARGKAIVAGVKAFAKFKSVEYQSIWDEALSNQVKRLGERWTKAVARGGEGSPEARRLLRELDTYAALGVSSENVESRFADVAMELAPTVLQDRLAGRKDAAARRREAIFLRASERSRSRGGGNYLWSAGYEEHHQRAVRIVTAEREGKTPRKEDVQRVSALARAAGEKPNTMLKSVRQELASDAFYRAGDEFRREAAQAEPNPDKLRRIADAIRREKVIIDAPGGTNYGPYALWEQPVRRLIRRALSDTVTPAQIAEERARIEKLAEITGFPSASEWFAEWRLAYFNLRSTRDQYQLEPRRQKTEAKIAEERLQAFESRVPSDVLNAIRKDQEEPRSREAYIEARHRGEVADDLLNDFYQDALRWIGDGTEKSMSYWRARASERRDILQTLTELDSLDQQKADPEVLARKRELEKKAEELRARIGDPIVSIEAPGAKVVVAKMPDGSCLPMHRVAGTDRWEGRFDVPAGIADGRYAILVYVDGERKAAVPVNVDTSAPSLEVRWDEGRAEISTDADVKRVAGFTPSGERVELVREAPGRFAARVPFGTEFVATDGAHNRSDAALTPGPSPSEGRGETRWTNPGVVSALAFVGDRLWVGTANDGGGFEGEARDAERPWVKTAVAYGDGLAVRYADGSVEVRGSGDPRRDEALKLPRHSTCLAVDGETLLVGTIGGYFEIRGGARKDVFPKELAGLVVTALLRDVNRTWVGTQGRGLAEVTADGKVVWHDERRGLRDDWVTCLGRDSQGRVVVGTFVGGASVLDGEWKAVPGTEGTCVTGISGAWIATRQGVFRDGRQDSNEEATALVVHGDEVWIGTRQGPKRLR